MSQEDERKPLIGLKASLTFFESSSTDEDVFGDDDASGSQTCTLSLRPCLIETPKTLSPKQSKQNPNEITSFDEALPKITTLLSNLQDYTIPKPFTGEMDFVPEHVTSKSLARKLLSFIKKTKPDINFRSENPNIIAQINIVRYSQGDKIDLKEFVNENLDSRVLSLIYFILSKTDNQNRSLYYSIESATEFIKSPDVAPISTLFPDFNFITIIHKIAVNLIGLFPHNPILESVINKLSKYDSSARDLFNLISDSDDDDDFDFDSSSFFESIQEMQQRPPPLLFQLIGENITNPLEIGQQSVSTLFTVTVTEPPYTISYLLSDGSYQMTPNQFLDWISQLYDTSKNDKASKHRSTKIDRGLFRNIVHSLSFIQGTETDEPSSSSLAEVTSETLISLFRYSQEANQIISLLPQSLPSELFPIYYPLFQIVNLTTLKPYKKGFLYPQIIENEFEAHHSLKNSDSNRLQKCINKMLENININKIKTKEIIPLTKKRIFSSDEKWDQNIIEALTLSDILIINYGRSPLTYEVFNTQIIIKLPFNIQTLKETIYYLYTKHIYPPYILFRLSFSLALSLLEFNPRLSCGFLFEGLYILNQYIPEICQGEFCRSSFLLFAETLEKIDCYYYSSLLFDIYFISNPDDIKFSNSIAQICQRHRDMTRAVFHYTQSMKSFVYNDKYDEALYISHLITNIYDEYSLFLSSISLLSFLLQRSYKIPISRKIEMNNDNKLQNRTLPVIKNDIKVCNFEPQSSSINTMLTAIYLVDLFIKKHYFKLANSLLKNLKLSTNNLTFIKIIEYSISKRYYYKNKINKFFMSLPLIEIKQRKNIINSKVSMLTASNFDTSIATIKLLINIFNSYEAFRHSLYFSEYLIQCISKIHLKDIGYALLYRSKSLEIGYNRIYSITFPFSWHIKSIPFMNFIPNYKNKIIFNTSNDYISELLSTLKITIDTFDKVGYLHKTIEATLMYLNVLMHYFIDPLYLIDEKINVEDIEIKNINLSVIINGIDFQNIDNYQTLTLTKNNFEDHLTSIIKNLEILVSKLMIPIQIIFIQILSAKLYLYQNKIENFKTKFEFSFNNLQKYFICTNYFVSRNLSLNILKLFQKILENMCQTLLFYNDNKFINSYLIIFDWFNDIQVMINNKIRVTENESQTMINSSLDVSNYALTNLSSLKFPNFFTTLTKSGLKLSTTENVEENSILTNLKKIKSNVRLFETQKIKEDEVLDINRELCKSIENIAESRRQKSEIKLPNKFTFEDIINSNKRNENLILIYRIFDSLYIYIPNLGYKKRIILKPNSNKYTFNIKDKTYKTSSNIFPGQFIEVISLLIQNNKKSKTIINENHKIIFEAIGNVLFDDIINTHFNQWKMIKDNNEKIFGKSNKGNLISLNIEEKPLLFNTSIDIIGLPFELMFPRHCIFRCYKYSNLLLHTEPHNKTPKLTIFKVKGEIEELKQSSTQRSYDSINTFIKSLGGSMTSIILSIKNNQRKYCDIFPLFLTKKKHENAFYLNKYSFCDIIDTQNKVKIKMKKMSIYLFTYGDMCEMPQMIDELMRLCHASLFLFVPSMYMKTALKKMKEMFERNKVRGEYIRNNKERKEIEIHMEMFKSPVVFYGLIKETLVRELNCPIPFFVTMH